MRPRHGSVDCRRHLSDTSAGLVNGPNFTYCLTPIFRGARKVQEVEGALAAIHATPIAATGLRPHRNQHRREHRVRFRHFDPTSRVITIRGSGIDLRSDGDQCYFLNRLAEGNFQVTVKALATSLSASASGPRQG